MIRVIGLLGLSLAAMAQETDGVFGRHDLNRDGKVTADELPNKTTFARFDLDKDGAITMAEYQKVSGKAAAGGLNFSRFTETQPSPPFPAMA